MEWFVKRLGISVLLVWLVATIVFLSGGVLGTFHHLYFSGTPIGVIALGSVLSALEVVPLAVVGFGLAVVAGVVLGIAVAWYDGLREVLTPLLELFRNTAALALLPVFTLLLGIGELSKVSIVAFAAFFPVLLNTVAGVRTVDPLLVRAARTLGLSNLQLFVKVVLPSAVPTIFTGIRMAGTASILVLIAAEMVGAKAGLGYLIVNAQSSFQIPQMYAGILTVSVFGLVVNIALVRLERHFSAWRTTPTGS